MRTLSVHEITAVIGCAGAMPYDVAEERARNIAHAIGLLPRPDADAAYEIAESVLGHVGGAPLTETQVETLALAVAALVPDVEDCRACDGGGTAERTGSLTTQIDPPGECRRCDGKGWVEQ